MVEIKRNILEISRKIYFQVYRSNVETNTLLVDFLIQQFNESYSQKYKVSWNTMFLAPSFKDEQLSSIEKNLVECAKDYLPSEATFYQDIRLWNPNW